MGKYCPDLQTHKHRRKYQQCQERYANATSPVKFILTYKLEPGPFSQVLLVRGHPLVTGVFVLYPNLSLGVWVFNSAPWSFGHRRKTTLKRVVECGILFRSLIF
jgi:hypothetical protein